MRTTQREKVEHLLRANGSRGVHTHELRQAYIANPSERICELEKAGWDISHTRERLNGTAFGCRYVKVSEPVFGSVGGGDVNECVASSETVTGTPGVGVQTGMSGVRSAPTGRHGCASDVPVCTPEPGRLFELGPSQSSHYQDEAA